MQTQLPSGNGPENVTLVQTLSADSPTATRSEQNNAQVRETILSKAQLEMIQQDAQLMALMQAHGYGAAQFAEGMALVGAAEATYQARQTALAKLAVITQNLTQEQDRARLAYSQFRALARAVFTDAGDRIQLGLRGETPQAFDLLVARARLGYKGALESPAYADKLTTYGMPADQIQGQLEELEAVMTHTQTATAVRAEAAQATQDRNSAASELGRWKTRFVTVLRYATRNQPDLAARAGL